MHGGCRNRAVSCLPDTGASRGGIEIPAWGEVLAIGATLGGALALGHVGVDIVPDARSGPVALEANACPGPAIASRPGLLKRLQRVDAAAPRGSVAEGPSGAGPRAVQRIPLISLGLVWGRPQSAISILTGSRSRDDE